MGKGKKAAKKAARARKAERSSTGGYGCLPKTELPKTECCVSKDRCRRCPIRMLKEGTLPDGLTVKKRVLVTTDGKKVTKKQLVRAA